MSKSPVERLMNVHPDLEVWWDSSPLVYDKWAQQMVDSAAPNKRATLAEQLQRLYNTQDPAQSLIRGCTTNPPLSLKAVKSDPKFWNEWIDDLIHSNPGLDYKEITWLTYKEVVKRGAEMMMPIWQASQGRYGWISGQLDPRLFTEKDVMIAQAEELSALQPNIMIKVPGSTEGIDVLRALAAKGISTNTTTCFTLPQILASARATQEGLKLVQKGSYYTSEQVDLSKWRAVITMMVGRLTEHDALATQARRRGIELTWQDKHWLGIAIFQRAYRLLKEDGYPSKMLACSMRQGPLVAGKSKFWDVEKLAGDVVFTCPPYVLEPLFELGDDLDFEDIETVQVPQRVLDKFMQIPYAIQAYDPNGMWLEQFNDHPATLDTVANFSQAMTGLEEYVAHRLAAVRHREPVMA
ncbi:MAG: transaldolase [Anaerolineae bacterium]|nr:transaldolase [Anaerolineae bacterium]MCB0222957.1 transaldolase [Anaerolineae bacterium]